MKVHRLIAATLCAAAFACGSDEINGVPDTSVPVDRPDVVVLYGFVAVNADTVTLQTVHGPGVVLGGPLVDELLELDGAFVVVRGGFTGEAPLVPPTLTVESYELIEA
jgi:hypothetical protein